MDFDNSVYSVTPPSLFLNENGPSIMLLGFDDSEVQQVSRVFDKFFPQNSIAYYYDTKPISDNTVAWALSTSKTVDFIIVNADNINITETYLCTSISQSHNDSNPMVFWMSAERKNKSLCKLLLRDKQKIYTCFDELDAVLTDELEHEH